MNLRETAELAKKAAAVQWVKWVHPNTEPANTGEEKKANVLQAAKIPTHCARCLNMNGCCFAANNCPAAPLHENCHCKAERIDNVTVTAECRLDKFTGYIFNDFYNDGKKQIYKDLGYTISDSTELKAEMEKQAYIAYITGNYKLNVLDPYGQRINIIITLVGKNGIIASFLTGWITYPDGRISLATPFTGYVKNKE